MAWVWLRVADTNNSPSFKVMLSMIDAAQVLTYDNVTSPGSFSDMVSRIRNRFVSPRHSWHRRLTASGCQDMMEVCNIERPWNESSRYPMSWDEMKAQFSIWAVLTSPLIMGAPCRQEGRLALC